VFQLRQQHWLRLSKRGGWAAALVAGALLAMIMSSGARASVRCAHSEAPTPQLEVFSYEDRRIDLDFAAATVRREGNRIVVINPIDFDRRGTAVRIECSGTPSTVFNTDTIVFQQTGLNFSTLDLSGGPLAPGATGEADGSNEIETVFRAKRGSLAYGTVSGTGAADEWSLGGDSREIAVFLDKVRPDEADVTFTGPGTPVPVAEPRDGNDRVDATGIRARGGILAILTGGRGDDVLLGSRFNDALEGGKGRDLLDAGSGSDELLSRDRFPDRVRCGPGNDRAVPGRDDRLSACERIRGPLAN
jgi:hemolysin type calcium-binding protein